MANEIARTKILGVGVSAVDMPMAVATVRRWVQEGRQNYAIFRDIHGVMQCQNDDELQRIHSNAGLVAPDGMPLVWLSQWRGQRQVQRVYGPDFMLEICRASIVAGERHFFYGGAPGVADRLAMKLKDRLPGLVVAGTYCPPFRPPTSSEEEQVVQLINRSHADYVWVGLSTPKQERWMARNIGRLQAPALLGVGAAFDIHSGIKRQAPLWMQRNGLEWAFRLMSEPRRLWKRYIYLAPKFVLLVAYEFLTSRSIG